MKKRIIITGAMGQDGKILSNILLKNNYSVIGIIKKKQLHKRIKKVKYFNVNLLHYDPIYKIIKKIKPYAIVHLASNNKSHSPKNLNKINYNIHYKSNFNMTYNLINAVVNNDRKIKFIFAGSSHMFGDTKKKKKLMRKHRLFQILFTQNTKLIHTNILWMLKENLILKLQPLYYLITIQNIEIKNFFYQE